MTILCRHYLVIPVDHIPTVKDLQRRPEDYSLGNLNIDNFRLNHAWLNKFGTFLAFWSSINFLILYSIASLVFSKSHVRSGENANSTRCTSMPSVQVLPCSYCLVLENLFFLALFSGLYLCAQIDWSWLEKICVKICFKPLCCPH